MSHACLNDKLEGQIADETLQNLIQPAFFLLKIFNKQFNYLI